MGKKRKTNKHLPERMYLKSGSYYFVDYFNKWHNLGRVYVEALAEYGSHVDPDRPCRTMAELLDRYLLEVSPKKSENTYKANLRESKYIRAAFGHIEIDRLKPVMVRQYLDARRKTPVSANREVALLSSMYSFAFDIGLTEIQNPCRGIKRFKEKPVDRYIEDWEYYAFREFAGPLIAAYMDFKYITGLRRCDILRINLNQIKEDGILVKVSKSKKSILIERTELLNQAIKNIRQLERPVNGMFLFTTRKGQPYSDSGFSSIWQRKMRKAIDEGIIKDRFRDHDIRAKTGSDTDLQHASELLAHSDKKITERHYQRKAAKVRPIG